MFIELKNHKAHVFEHNKIEDPESNIFILPGAGMDHRIGSMIDMSQLYSSSNVFSLDFPGHGFTTGEVLYSIEEMSEFLIQLLKKMNIENPILIGHSMGGLIALDVSLKLDCKLSILMNTSYPLMVGEILLQHAKGNLDQANEFMTKYGVFNVPETKVQAKTFGTMGSGFYGRSKGTIKSPYGTKNIENDPQREINVYPLKRLFNQTQKEIMSHDLKACSAYKAEDISKIKNTSFIYGEKDKLARFNPENDIHASTEEKNIVIMDNTGHFPFFLKAPKSFQKF